MAVQGVHTTISGQLELDMATAPANGCGKATNDVSTAVQRQPLSRVPCVPHRRGRNAQAWLLAFHPLCLPTDQQAHACTEASQNCVHAERAASQTRQNRRHAPRPLSRATLAGAFLYTLSTGPRKVTSSRSSLCTLGCLLSATC